MFEDYSHRAVQVIMVARLKAGQRGAAALEIEDLLVALLIEDQGGALNVVFDRPGNAASPAAPNPPRHFVPPDVASELLARVEALCARSRPVPRTSDMPLSDSVKRAFDEAAHLRDELKQRYVEPLHLLAAALEGQSSKAVQIFRETGITRDDVLKALKEEALSQPRPLVPAGKAVSGGVPLYSSRARNINFLARLKARMRGSAVIELEDLLVALLIEDQGGFYSAVSEVAGVGIDVTSVDLRPHAPVVAPDLADRLLAHVQALCSRSQPLPPDAPIPMSDGVKRAFALADLLRSALRQTEVGPLHVLAGVLEDRSNKAVQMVLEAGVTRDAVLGAIRGEAA